MREKIYKDLEARLRGASVPPALLADRYAVDSRHWRKRRAVKGAKSCKVC